LLIRALSLLVFLPEHEQGINILICLLYDPNVHLRPSEMASKTQKPPQPDPLDFFPFRGQYGSTALGGTLFVAVRAFVPVFFYAILAPPTSPYSLFTRYPSLAPAYPPPANVSSSLIPTKALGTLSTTLGLSPVSTIIWLGSVLPTLSFTAYNLLWRGEKLPLTGQGGAVQITTQVNITDAFHGLIFIYTAVRNPTWSPRVFAFTPIIFLLGFALHVAADHSKYLFRKDRSNRGKVLRSGVWGVVRHPNFLGFTIWRVAFAVAVGGWGFGALLAVGFGALFWGTSIPILEAYMERYGEEWEKTKREVRWKMIPGVW
jgi:protein-S-isoprenylcysteine O-methyltransferase Ste14